jgi:hypothetical protein
VEPIINLDENYIVDVPILKYNYRIKVASRSIEFQISANCEQDALDYAVNYLSRSYPDAVMTLDQEDELKAQGILEKYVSGGDRGEYLAAKDITIERTLNEKDVS